MMFVTSLSSSSSSTLSKSSAMALAPSPPSSQQQQHLSSSIAVIGGGASGMFASIQAAECLKELLKSTATSSPTSSPQVVVLEATSKTLQKVRISGGGRCNVMHDTTKSTSTLLAGYPRGQKELRGLFHKHFTPTMARSWFEDRGVELKVENDGRVFPTSDSSETIIQTLLCAADTAGVHVRLKSKVEAIDVDTETTATVNSPNFCVHFKDGSTESFGAIIMATGSSPTGYHLVQNCLEHVLDKRVPSLFTLNCKLAVKEGGLLYGLSGVSVPSGRVTLGNKKKKLFQEGPILISHHGLTGPAVLRLSAFGALEFHELNYRSEISVNWDTETFSDQPEKVLEEQLWPVTSTNPKRTIGSGCPIPSSSIPKRLWKSLVEQSGIPKDAVWGAVSKKLVRKLAHQIVACPIETTGKGTFKEEFVTAGGISLKEINMKTMESKRLPGLFFCGELINIDGITGGYNFMNCWSTGWTAGSSAAEHVLSLPEEENTIPATNSNNVGTPSKAAVQQ